MLPINTILHPTDFSEHSEHAFALACSLARDHHTHLLVLHVAAPANHAMNARGVDPNFNSEEWYREALEELHSHQPSTPNVCLSYKFVEGDPATSILQVAAECEADLIVMGSHGNSGFQRLLMGSIAEQIVRQASCLVVTVNNPVPAAEVETYGSAYAMSEAPLQEMVTG
ncbi:MAG: universal stress protein [Planctomycetes bacterium]|nr:universal stress protein [Planctomycetota bacterium]